MVFQVEVRWNVKQFGPVIREAVAATSKTIQERARKDVAAGVRHPGRFVKGTTTKVARVRGGYAIQLFLRPTFAKVWEYGGTSVGKPLLWLPAPGNKVKLRNFGGKLIKRGRVLVTASRTVAIRGMAGTGQKAGQVKYIGVASVTHRRRFHLREIAMDEANKFVQKMGLAAKRS